VFSYHQRTRISTPVTQIRYNIGLLLCWGTQLRPETQTTPDLLPIYKAFCKTCSFGIATLSTYCTAPRCLLNAYKQYCAWRRNPFLLPNSGHVAVKRCIYACCRPWSTRTCAQAALCTTDDHLRYLHEHGCPWDQRTVVNALSSCDSSDGNASNDFQTNYATEGTCLRYALENDCPCDVEVLREAMKNSVQNDNKGTRTEGITYVTTTLLLGNILQPNLCSYRINDSYFMLGALASLSVANAWKLYSA